MLEFLIERINEDGYPEFDLPYSQWSAVLRPNTIPSTMVAGSVPGNYAIEVEGYVMSFIDEMLGPQVVAESEDMPAELARKIIGEIHANIEQAMGRPYELLETPGDKPVRFVF